MKQIIGTLGSEPNGRRPGWAPNNYSAARGPNVKPCRRNTSVNRGCWRTIICVSARSLGGLKRGRMYLEVPAVSQGARAHKDAGRADERGI
jgi:hypothetical protein